MRVGKYELGAKLGQGGFGVIHVARDTELGRDVALKLLRPDQAFNHQAVQRFLQEARAAARIHHAGIVTVYESGQLPDGSLFIAMELLAGETLAQRLKRGRLPVGVAIGFARQMAAALAAAHAVGIIHRDLKPANVFLVADPAVVGGERVKILDFGIAKLVDDFGSSVQTHSMIMLGTPMYMSPEQCKSSARVDARSDIYALGCMLFEMVCGQTPFAGDSGELIAKHQLIPAPLATEIAPHVPQPLAQLIAAMLAKSADERPPTMHAVIDTLDAIESEPPPDTQERRIEAVPARRKKGLAIGAGVAILVGVVTAVVATRHPAKPAQVARRPIDAAVVAIDAAVVAPAPPPADDAGRIRIECLQALSDHHWSDAEACAGRLAPLDAAKAQELKARAESEQKAELALDKLKAAISDGRSDDAKQAFADISEESIFRKEAERALACDVPGLRAQGMTLEQQGKHRDALAKLEEALACNPNDARIAQLAYMAACNAHDVDKARTYWADLPAKTQQPLLAICVRNHITKAQLEGAPVAAAAPPKQPDDAAPACNAEDEQTKGMEAEQDGKHAAALARFEAGMACPDANKVRLAQLAFMAACNIPDRRKAKQYWPMIGTPARNQLLQMCVRNGILQSQLE